MADYVSAAPNPKELAKAFRGLGYSPAAALADLLDNSLSASASQVEITFDWNDGAPRIIVQDNGVGMSAEDLTQAMRLGAGVDKPRLAGDLGRFGMGMKTASLSQARTMTVASKHHGLVSVATWDIDHIEQVDAWDLQIGARSELDADSLLGGVLSGTVTVWQHLDHFFGGSEPTIDVFLQLAETVTHHLGMVFHRFLDSRRLIISVNGKPIQSWDPLAADEPKCVRGQKQTLFSPDGSQSTAFQGCVMPPPSDLSPVQDDLYGGPSGWIAQQGFYVYRCDRLIVAGGWLNLGRSGKPWKLDRDHQLARISLDLSNVSDADWQLDIKKSSILVPPAFIPLLQKHAREIRRLSKRAISSRHRASAGTVSTETGHPPVWVVERVGALVKYRVDRRHPLIVAMRQTAGSGRTLRDFLNALDAGLPIQGDFPQTATANATALQAAQTRDRVKAARNLYYSLRKAMALSAEEALERVLATPGFQGFEVAVAAAMESYELELTKVST